MKIKDLTGFQLENIGMATQSDRDGKSAIRK